jgi:superoxide dismutase, Fe-Mn family
MAYELPPLLYEYEALEPTIDTETMHLHHDKHHNTYVTNLNAAIDKHPELASKTAKELIKNLDAVPEDIRAAVRNNGGGHVNHSQFWKTMTPGGAKEPTGALAAAINAKFGSFDEFKTQFQAAGAGRFGSGWVWLIKEGNGVAITSTPNQDNPMMEGKQAILGNDVWEHAYYLKYKNVRPDYLKAWWAVVNWDIIGERFEKS